MEKLILIDGSGLIYRGFYAVPPFMRSPAGVQTNAVFGFVNILFALLGKYKPDYIAIAFDMRGPTFRHKQYAAYKATRIKAPDELYAQIPIVKELVKIFKIPSFETAGFEADDILATIVDKMRGHPNLEIQIATGDFDVFQLVSDHVSILYPAKGFKDATIYQTQNVREKYGILPTQISDYKALCGDSSDNIPGVRGIGPKTALNLLDTYSSLENIYENISSITPESVQKKLQLDEKNAFLSKQLATLQKDVPCDFDLKSCHTSAFDVSAVIKEFDKLGFRSFQKRLDEILPGNSHSAQPKAAEIKVEPKEEQTSLF